MRYLFLSLLFPLPVFATVSVQPYAVQDFYKSAVNDAHYASVATRATSATYGTVYALRKLAVSAASMGAVVRAAMGGPFGLALTAALALKDWHFDGTAIMSDGIPASQLYPCQSPASCLSAVYIAQSSFGGGIKTFPDFGSAVAWLLTTYPGDFDHIQYGGNSYVYKNFYGSVSIGRVYPGTGAPSDSSIVVGAGVISDGDVGQQIFDLASNNPQYRTLPQSILDDAVKTGTATSVWPELSNDVSSLTDELTSADTSSEPAPDAATFFADKPEPVKSIASSEIDIPTDYNRENTQQSIFDDVHKIYTWLDGDVPTFSDVPPPSDQTITIDSFDDSQFSGMGGGCPAPLSMPVLSSSITLSYDPLCSFVSKLRPLLITMSLISAISIVLFEIA